jgi:hypothetical protein
VRRRVVITGCGVVAAAPFELDRFFGALVAGTRFIGPLRSFSCPGHEAPVGCEATLPPEDEAASPPPQPSIHGEAMAQGERSRCLDLALPRRGGPTPRWPAICSASGSRSARRWARRGRSAR